MIYDEECDGARYDKATYDCAIRSKYRLYRNDHNGFREMIAMSLSDPIEIWFDVFSDDRDMCDRFMNELRVREQYNNKCV